jgi:hypothetical protein
MMMRVIWGAIGWLACTAAVWAGGDGSIRVMTQNQYLGADIAPLLSAPSEVFNETLVRVLEQVAATRFTERAKRQARTIAAESPDVVALQEAWAFSCIDLPAPTPGQGCANPTIAAAFVDQLDVTLAELASAGASYRAVAAVKNTDLRSIQLPGLPPGVPFVIDGFQALLVAVDRDVILARGDVAAAAVPFAAYPGAVCPRPSLDGCLYQLVVQAQTPAGPLNVERGFVAVDAVVHGRAYRVANTHLEVREVVAGNPYSRLFQSAQALELVQVLLGTTPGTHSLVLMGDMNSAPEDQPLPPVPVLPPPFDILGVVPPYIQFARAGLTDAWTLRPGAVAGLTCCQAEDLLNRKSSLYERIDLIWSAAAPAKVKQARVVGAKVSDRTPPAGQGLWPSDHGGVSIELEF